MDKAAKINVNNTPKDKNKTNNYSPIQLQFLPLKTYQMLKNLRKVLIFWEGHKILRNLPQLFDWQYIGQTIGWIVWPSQIVWKDIKTRGLVCYGDSAANA